MKICNVPSFDLAYLVLTGYVKMLPVHVYMSEVAKASKDVIMWGPQARLLGVVLRKHARDTVGPYIARIIESFDLSDNIGVDSKKVTAILGSKAFQASLKKGFKDTKLKVNKSLQLASKKSQSYFKKNLQKVDVAVDWELLMVEALSGHVTTFVETYPKRILAPEVKRLVKLAKTKPDFRHVDNFLIKERVESLYTKADAYMMNLGDIYAGRAWQGTTLSMAKEQHASEYQIVAQNDTTVCLVCERMDGRTFPVDPVYDKWDNYLGTQGDADQIREALPFVRLNDVDNKTPKQVRDLLVFPPFHGRCRCEMSIIY